MLDCDHGAARVTDSKTDRGSHPMLCSTIDHASVRVGRQVAQALTRAVDTSVIHQEDLGVQHQLFQAFQNLGKQWSLVTDGDDNRQFASGLMRDPRRARDPRRVGHRVGNQIKCFVDATDCLRSVTLRQPVGLDLDTCCRSRCIRKGTHGFAEKGDKKRTDTFGR